MELEWIATPLAGGLIGYSTNWLAIKMLFRPYGEKRFLGRTLPFTPGLIPKERKRIAKSFGEVVEQYLLTEEVLVRELTSEKVEGMLIGAIEEKLFTREGRLSLETLLPLGDVEKAQLLEGLSGRIRGEMETAIYLKDEEIKGGVYALVDDEHFAAAARQVIARLVEEKFGALGSMFVNTDSIYASIRGALLDKLEERTVLEWLQLWEKRLPEPLSAGPLLESLLFQPVEVTSQTRKLLDQKIKAVYDALVREYLTKIIRTAQVGKIAEAQINRLETRQLERMLLDITSRELSAITWLGGILGALLGILLLVFQSL
ncbi:DUF445 family protein [Anaerotalea alkaliphila]|uniref:DUF445 family protein n=1 Tax=Anaerotalea alkaliphila TaxID=2662126 RepID=A0A7X5KP15_9FIRM|nr:DUF445 family protein [Anaerotalea alkaliphila]NDL67367.1 DUF445 family protein [Anaerotalea alkaliphila]